MKKVEKISMIKKLLLIGCVTKMGLCSDENQFPNLPSSHYATILKAAHVGDKNAVCEFIASGTNTNVLGGFGQTILHEAAGSGNLGPVRYLTENCNIDAKTLNKNGQTALMSAAFYGKLDVVRYLIENQHLDPTVTDAPGWNALIHAVSGPNGQLSVVRYLIDERHLDPNINVPFSGNILVAAVSNGNLEIVRYLIEEKHFDPNTRSPYDASLLDLVPVVRRNLALENYLLAMNSVDDQSFRNALAQRSEATRRFLPQDILATLDRKETVDADDINRAFSYVANEFTIRINSIFRTLTISSNQLPEIYIRELMKNGGPDPKRPGADFTEKEFETAAAVMQGFTENYTTLMERLASVFSVERGLAIYDRYNSGEFIDE